MKELDLLLEQARAGEVYSPNEMLNKAKEAWGYIEQGLGNNREAEVLFLLGKAYFRLSRFQEAILHLEKAKRQNEKDLRLETEIFNALGNVHLYMGMYDQGFGYYQKGYLLAIKAEDEEMEAKFLNNLGEIYKYFNDYESALACYERSYELQKKMETIQTASVPLCNIGSVYLEKGDWIKAETITLEALELAEKEKNRIIESACWKDLASVENEKGNKHQALACLKKSFEIVEQTGEKYHISEIKTLLGKQYLENSQYDLSLNMFEDAFKIAEEIDAHDMQVKALIGLGEYYERKMCFKESANCYSKSLALKGKIEDKEKTQILRRIKTYKNPELTQREIDVFKRLNLELKEKTEALEKISQIDGLTGVYNKRSFLKQYKKHWNIAMRLQKPISVLMIDIDFFAEYNNLYGHFEGDEVLRKIASIIEKSVRRGGDLVGRFGGDEFMVALTNTDKMGARIIAEKIKDAVKKESILHEASSVSPYITLSIGISTITPSLSDSPEALLRQSDLAMYQVKQSDRNNIHCE